jgi:aspartyl-tRNA(Asn)/glutamyl-tRNA(Gln) amidotransferase subunit B
MKYEPVIGLEIHAELLTQSKMFCSCPVVDLTEAPPNSAVCPVCSGMPGTLPVVNRQAVEHALRVALALDCQVYTTSIFERKNYFYPDLPKGFQISQYQHPLARHGQLPIRVGQEERVIRIRRVHLEEDTGKSTHFSSWEDGGGADEEEAGHRSGGSQTLRSQTLPYSLIDLNRSGVPLLEIVTEPDMHSAAEVGAYARGLRQLLRYLEVNSGDMQKGVLRIEPNISVRPVGSTSLGTRSEVKNLNSFRALERAVDYEIERQIALIEAGQPVVQETVGWDESRQITVPQRSKEEAHDYRYFPEPDLPPLIVEPAWVEAVRAGLPERPYQRTFRFASQYSLNDYDAALLTEEKAVADYFEAVLESSPGVDPKTAANWIAGELFALINQAGQTIETQAVPPDRLGELLQLLESGAVNQPSAKKVLAEMFASGSKAPAIIAALGLDQVTDRGEIQAWVAQVLQENPDEVGEYLSGKEAIANWLFGQVMRLAGGRADPQVVRRALASGLAKLKDEA